VLEYVNDYRVANLSRYGDAEVFIIVIEEGNELINHVLIRMALAACY
jgi:hypothetical protein